MQFDCSILRHKSCTCNFGKLSKKLIKEQVCGIIHFLISAMAQPGDRLKEVMLLSIIMPFCSVIDADIVCNSLI